MGLNCTGPLNMGNFSLNAYHVYYMICRCLNLQMENCVEVDVDCKVVHGFLMRCGGWGVGIFNAHVAQGSALLD